VFISWKAEQAPIESKTNQKKSCFIIYTHAGLNNIATYACL